MTAAAPGTAVPALPIAAVKQRPDPSRQWQDKVTERIAAGELAPFVPGVAQTIAARLGDAERKPGWGRLVPGAEVRVGPPPIPRKAARLPDASPERVDEARHVR